MFPSAKSGDKTEQQEERSEKIWQGRWYKVSVKKCTPSTRLLKLWMPHPWSMMGLWAVPAHGRGVGDKMVFKASSSPNHSVILTL